MFGSKDCLCVIYKRVQTYPSLQISTDGKLMEIRGQLLNCTSCLFDRCRYYCRSILQSFLQLKQLDLRKFIGQGYDGAATFSGKITGVHKRIQTFCAHAIYIQCSCHRLHLTSIQAAASVKEIKIFFGIMTSVWKLFYYSTQNAYEFFCKLDVESL